MSGFRVKSFFLCLIVLFASATSVAWAFSCSRPGTILNSLTLQDGSPVTLDSMWVVGQSGGSLVVREPWDQNLTISCPLSDPISTPEFCSVEITGVMGTQAGVRVLVPTLIRMYVDANGNVFSFFPKQPDRPWAWNYFTDLFPQGGPARNLSSRATQPLDSEALDITPTLSAPIGSIAAAKLSPDEGSAFTLTGKVVTAAFSDCFYIEEPDRSCGIRVEPSNSAVGAGEIVTVTGTVEDDGSECYISATNVQITGAGSVNSLYLTQRSAAAGAFGWQPALQPGVSQYSDSNGNGLGLNPVGLLVRVQGTVTGPTTPVSGTYYLDDGTGLLDPLGQGWWKGIKVEYVGDGTPPTYNVGDCVSGVTGVLGAESNWGIVPVVRIPCPRIIHVKTSANGGNDSHDGLTWQTAKATLSGIHGAMSVAASGDEIWVANGTYQEASTITLKAGVGLYGSFAGTETARQRNWSTYGSILDGGSSGWPVVTAGTGAVAGNTVIDGFTIRHGTAARGGGIYCSVGSLTISHNTITNNSASGIDSVGGGICCASSSPPIVSNNIVENNTAGYYGGGISCSSPFGTISYNLISGNTVDGYGGGGINAYGSSATISNNVVTGNHADEGEGGGIFSSSGTISHNTITGNSATSGGGIYSYGATSAQAIVYNTITGNSGAYGGGGITCDSSAARIADNGVSSNDGGGIFCYESPCEISNNTVAHNTGDGVELSSSVASITNTIVAWNTGNGFLVYGTGSPIVRYDDVYGQSTNYSGIPNQTNNNGNISANPLLNTQDYVHFIPLTPSGNPCKDHGLNSIILQGDTDIDGNYRIQGLTVEIGAQEFPGCAPEMMWLSANQLYGTVNCGRVVTAYVYDPMTKRPAVGRQISFSINGGEIVSITPDGSVDPSQLSASGVTDSDGKLNITVTSGIQRTVVVTANLTTRCGTQTQYAPTLYFGYFQVGFAYSICDSMGDPDSAELYLQRISNKYPAITYSRVDLDSFSTDLSKYNVIFLILPEGYLSDHYPALSAFVNLGRQRRVVLVGEYSANSWLCCDNVELNAVAQALGMLSRFDTAQDTTYDQTPPNGPDITRLCAVVSSHYLMQGVTNMWDSAVNAFSTWQGCARPLAYIHDSGAPPLSPWIVEEDTASAGSRIAIHDSSMFYSNSADPAHSYDDINDTVPNKNFRFVFNLCTVFPQ